MKHFLFQTRFWCILEVLQIICKITSSQTSTLQRPFRGPLSLGHCRGRLTYSPRQGRGTWAHPGPMHAATDHLWRRPTQEEPSSHRTTHKCGSAQLTMKNSNDTWDKHHWLVWYGGRQILLRYRGPCAELCGGVLTHRCDKLHGVVLFLHQDNQCGSTLHTLRKDYLHTLRKDYIHIPAANTCQRSPELLKPGETLANNTVKRRTRIWRARGRPASLKCVKSVITPWRNMRMEKGVGWGIK